MKHLPRDRNVVHQAVAFGSMISVDDDALPEDAAGAITEGQCVEDAAGVINE